MTKRLTIITTLWIAALISVATAAIPPRNSNSPAGPPTVSKVQDADAMRLEGEKRFRANCGRCHAAPQKFPPRMMATILRHMRVRATITDEDMRLVLYYMTQ
jgi:mono/diheme cytochrome c family protein